jgi:GntR family transcriptional regulator of arabinose operon
MFLGPKAENIYNSLTKDIADGKYLSGERLPTEHKLCEIFEASRNTVRNALAKLVEAGLIVNRPGAGCYIAEKSNTQSQERQKIISLMFHGDMISLSLIQNAIIENGYSLSLFTQQTEGWDSEFEKLFLKKVMEQRHFALLASCTPRAPLNNDLLNELVESGVKVIHIEPYESELPRQNFFMPDYHQAGHAAALYLLARGYRKLFFCDNHSDVPFMELLKSGIFQAGKENGIEVVGININQLGDSVGKKQKFFSAWDKNSGVICPVLSQQKVVAEAIVLSGFKLAEDIGTVGVKLMGDKLGEEWPFDHLHFSRQSGYQELVELVTRADFNGIHRLIPPQIIHKKTTREI